MGVPTSKGIRHPRTSKTTCFLGRTEDRYCVGDRNSSVVTLAKHEIDRNSTGGVYALSYQQTLST